VFDKGEMKDASAVQGAEEERVVTLLLSGMGIDCELCSMVVGALGELMGKPRLGGPGDSGAGAMLEDSGALFPLQSLSAGGTEGDSGFSGGQEDKDPAGCKALATQNFDVVLTPVAMASSFASLPSVVSWCPPLAEPRRRFSSLPSVVSWCPPRAPTQELQVVALGAAVSELALHDSVGVDQAVPAADIAVEESGAAQEAGGGVPSADPLRIEELGYVATPAVVTSAGAEVLNLWEEADEGGPKGGGFDVIDLPPIALQLRQNLIADHGAALLALALTDPAGSPETLTSLRGVRGKQQPLP